MRLRHIYISLLFAITMALPELAQQDLRGAFGPGRGDPAVYPGTELQRHIIDLTRFPRARCNDNSPAILYFRPASRAADADKWSINLQGGGTCGSGVDCSMRWFSVGTNFGSNNMTSVGFPDRTDENGIFERDTPYGQQNPIDSWNQVFIHYCSSDSWSGTMPDETLSGLDFRPLLDYPDAPAACLVPKDYKISFLGREIFDAAIATLQRNGVGPLVYQPPERSQGPITMPNLNSASKVLLSGGSAGGGGVIHNLDHLRSMLPASTNLAGLSDSAFRPPKDNMDLSFTRLCASQGACTADAQTLYNYVKGEYQVWGEAGGTDESCLTFHPPADRWKSADSHHIVTNHVTTPFFVRMDEFDPLGLKAYQDDNIFLPNSTNRPISQLEFGQAVRSDIQSLELLRLTAEERGSISTTPGAFSAACVQHDVLRTNSGVYNTSIKRHGSDITMYDLLTNWVRGNGESLMAAIPDPAHSDSNCP